MTDQNFPFDDDNDSDEDTGGSKGDSDNKSFADLRKAYNRTTRELKAAQTELEPLKVFKAERVAQERASAITSAFEEAKLNPIHSRLFAALNPEGDVTPGIVQAFATEYGLVDESGRDADAASGTSNTGTGFTPVIVGGAAGNASGMISRQDWIAMQKAGELDKAQRLFKEGRVDLSDIGR